MSAPDENGKLIARLARIPRSWRDPTVRYSKKTGIFDGRFHSTIGVTVDGAVERLRCAEELIGQKLLLNEYDALNQVEHDNVVSSRWARRYRGRLYVATSWIDVKERESTPIPLPRLLERMAGAARGVAAMHRAGLIHRDLKPEKILFEKSRALVTGLEFAAPPGKRESSSFTPKFAAPEQVLGEDVGPQADVYALGMTFYSLFIENRFPLLLQTSAPALGGEDQRDHEETPFLSATTTLGAFRTSDEADPPDDAHGSEFLIGTKVRFHSRLRKTLEGVRHAHLVGPVLEVARRATRMDPQHRFEEADQFANAVTDLIERLSTSTLG